MRTLTSLYSFRYVLPAAGLVALLAACADAPTAAPIAPSFGAASTSGTDTTYTTFKVNPTSKQTTVVGPHKVVIPAGAVCDPAVSSYGSGEWDQPCTPISEPLTFTAKAWTDANGRPQVVFSPDVRFAPNATVTLYLMDKKIASSAMGTIAWCPTGGASCVNESLADPDVATMFDAASGYVYRRVKHFSGYTVTVD